ncbi:hypothetical protein [Pseudomonas lactis]|uniref:hypothetical protein n=1 Tax=Pseudomonas lactis TaxID=1615674 RepID=UPI00110CF647|nr:hypothetical protein [Pseudomonas lactis]
MTSIDTWPPWAAIIVLGAPGLLSVAGIAHSLHLSHRHLDALKDALKNSRYIYLWGDSLGKRGLIWSLLEISKIAGMVVWPRAYVLTGDVNPADIETFPARLKRRLIVNMTLMFTSFTWGVVAAMLVKFR